MKPDLIIFDCDGVLVDSEPLAMRVLVDRVAETGVRLDPAVVRSRFLGASLASTRQALRREFGVELSDSDLASMRARLHALFRAELAPVAGVAEALDAIDIPRCVASSSQPERIELSLRVAGLYHRLTPHVFSATMVAEGKPAPDLFLHAATAMGADPARCLVIEDSPAGVKAARRAGMTVYGFTGAAHARGGDHAAALREAGAALVFGAMRDLPGLVAAPSGGGDAVAADGLVIGVDVGTLGVRAGVFTARGAMLGRAERAIELHRRGADIAEYDSEDIWRGVCGAVRAALAEAGADPAAIRGVGFDATTSLVIRDRAGRPLRLETDGDGGGDTIAWLDHRAAEEAALCDATGHPLLAANGGATSPELQTPKLMWLKRRRPKVWARLGHAFDLADFLTWRATGSGARSQCTLACKWPYRGDAPAGWDRGFLAAVGLSDLVERSGLPARASPVGADLGPLTPAAAAELGLTARCRVGAGMIDAHAGMLGLLGGHAAPGAAARRVGLIAGTSTCVMALSPSPDGGAGLWGPYRDAVLPGLWVVEGGQSATGALLDHLLRLHAAGGAADAATHRRVTARIAQLRAAEGPGFAARLHVLPDFHGNRSPLADPRALGVVSGLALDDGFDGLCRLYWRTAVGLALGLRQVLEAFGARGDRIGTLHIAGGHAHNPMLCELYADATGCAVAGSTAPDPVLLGSAMVAATAAGLHPGLAAAAQAMAAADAPAVGPVAGRSIAGADHAISRAMPAHRAEIEALAAG